MLGFSEDGNMAWLLRKVTCLSALGLTVELCREGRPPCKAKAEVPCRCGKEGAERMLKGTDGDGERQGLGGRMGRGWAWEPQAASAARLQGQLSKITASRMWCVLAPR